MTTTCEADKLIQIVIAVAFAEGGVDQVGPTPPVATAVVGDRVRPRLDHAHHLPHQGAVVAQASLGCAVGGRRGEQRVELPQGGQILILSKSRCLQIGVEVDPIIHCS